MRYLTQRALRAALSISVILTILLGVPAGAIGSSAAAYTSAIGANTLWSRGIDGSGSTVVVIDSGVADVPELASSVVLRKSFSGSDPAVDEFGHGTFVAGLVHRTAPGARIISLKVAGPDGSVDVTQVLAALQWSVSHRAAYDIDVINLSFGTDANTTYLHDPLNFAVERAWDSGIVVVACSGNVEQTGVVSKPGDDPLVITAGVFDDTDTVELADDFSTVPSGVRTVDGFLKPDVLAPGAHVESVRSPGSSAELGYPTGLVGTTDMRGSGTSFSSAITAAGVALLLDANPTWSPNRVKAQLRYGGRAISGSSVQGVWLPGAMRAQVSNVDQLIPRSIGDGSIGASRGLAGVIAHDAGSDPYVVTGSMTTQHHTFNSREFRTGRWTRESWKYSQWSGGGWNETGWAAYSWRGYAWGAATWWGYQWG